MTFLTIKRENPYLVFFLEPSNHFIFLLFSCKTLNKWRTITNNGYSQEPITLALSLFQNVKNTHYKTNFWSYPLIHYNALFGYLILAFFSHFCILVLLLILITLHLSIFLSPKTNNMTNLIRVCLSLGVSIHVFNGQQSYHSMHI